MPARLTGPALVNALNGLHSYLGVIIATTTKSNHDTAVPFNNTGDALKGRTLMVQSDTAFYLYHGTLNTATATSTNGMLIGAGERVALTMTRDHGWLAAVAVSGTANVKVWEMI